MLSCGLLTALFLPLVYGRKLPLILGETEAGKTHLSRQKAYAWSQDAETIHQRYLRDHPNEKQPSLSGNQKSKRSKAAGKCVRNSHLERAWNKGQKGLGGRRPLQSLIINTLEHLPLSGTAITTD